MWGELEHDCGWIIRRNGACPWLNCQATGYQWVSRKGRWLNFSLNIKAQVCESLCQWTAGEKPRKLLCVVTFMEHDFQWVQVAGFHPGNNRLHWLSAAALDSKMFRDKTRTRRPNRLFHTLGGIQSRQGKVRYIYNGYGFHRREMKAIEKCRAEVLRPWYPFKSEVGGPNAQCIWRWPF